MSGLKEFLGEVSPIVTIAAEFLIAVLPYLEESANVRGEVPPLAHPADDEEQEGPYEAPAFYEIQ